MENREDILQEENQKIDIIPLLLGAWRHFKKTWWLLLLLCAVCGVSLCVYRIQTYTPVYVAYSSFVVDSGSGTTSYASSLTKIEIAETFPYILESGALKNVVMEQLGVEELNASISASVLSDTSLLQISVTAGDPQYAYDVLEAVVENYPTVARYIIGETELTLLDSSGVPSGASNGYSVRSLLVQGAMLGAVIYLCVLAFLLFTRKTVLSEADLKDSISVSCLASIPQLNRKRRTKNLETYYLIDQKNIGEPFRESVNMLRIRAGRQFEKNESRVILVTSTGEGEGKTTIAANLALSFSKKGYRVLVLDADLRSPSVARAFGREPGQGLPDILSNMSGNTSENTHGNTAENALVRYAKGLYLLSGKPAASRSEVASILGGAELRELLAAFREKFDYIFIDTPPCGMLPDAITLAPVCDEAILVVKQDFIAKERVLSAMGSLVNTGIHIAGFVINSEKTGIGSYGYGRYGYGRYGYRRYGYGRYGYGRYGYGYGYGSSKSSGHGGYGYGYGNADREDVYDPDAEEKQ